MVYILKHFSADESHHSMFSPCFPVGRFLYPLSIFLRIPVVAAVEKGEFICGDCLRNGIICHYSSERVGAIDFPAVEKADCDGIMGTGEGAAHAEGAGGAEYRPAVFHPDDIHRADGGAE